MSAYLVEPEHIAELCKFAWRNTHDAHCVNMVHRRVILSGSETEKRQTAARILAEANIASIEARYPDSPDMLIDGFVDLVLAELKSQPNLMLGANDIWNMAQCLDYQSCEVEGWADQDAYWIIDGIKNEAGRIMASCNNKISWSYDHDSWRAYIKREREKANARYAEWQASREAAQ